MRFLMLQSVLFISAFLFAREVMLDAKLSWDAGFFYEWIKELLGHLGSRELRSQITHITLGSMPLDT